MVNVVIDFSGKFSGFILFKSFFYKLENKGSMFFANDPATVDDVGLDMEGIKERINSFLFNKGSNKWNMTLIVDRGQQVEEPLEASLSNIINTSKREIIEKLSDKFPFNTLYVLIVDSAGRDGYGKGVSEGIKLSRDIDTDGYVQDTYGLIDEEVFFSEAHLIRMGEDWESIKKSHPINNQGRIDNSTYLLQEVIERFNNDYFIPIINELKKKNDSFFLWYKAALEKSQNEFINSFKDSINRSNDYIDRIENPVEILKQCFKSHIALAGNRNTIILRMDFDNHLSDISYDTAKYRYLLEVISVLILISEKDMKKILPGNDITRKANWRIKGSFQEDKLSQLFYSYLTKLKKENEKLGRYTVADIEYEEYTPITFNPSMVMEKPKISEVPQFSSYYGEKDEYKIKVFADNLYKRYKYALDHSQKRMRELSASLRIQKEGSTGEITKKAGVLEVEYIVKEYERKILEQQKKLINFRENIELEDKTSIKKKYYDFVEKAKDISMQRPKKEEVRNIILLISAAAFLVYPLWYRYVSFNYQSLLFALIINISLPILALLVANSKGKKVKIELEACVAYIVNDSEKIIERLYEGDKNVSKYINDIYNLMMMKKYVSSCREKLDAANKKITRFNYHKKMLDEHIELGEIVIDKLKIHKPKEYLDMEKLNLVLDFSCENNQVYCPLEYTDLYQGVSSRININNQAEQKLNLPILGYIDKFILIDDKEYSHD
ncbi:hypothetical protein ACPWSR_02115 [Alloiococcus sp. CFN-8]|uniref:hypothetical protein n=1 Tax=Alloiococcus sp. CFN-8 TaxID=3416081 RepID=UPI003CECFEF1